MVLDRNLLFFILRRTLNGFPDNVSLSHKNESPILQRSDLYGSFFVVNDSEMDRVSIRNLPDEAYIYLLTTTTHKLIADHLLSRTHPPGQNRF